MASILKSSHAPPTHLLYDNLILLTLAPGLISLLKEASWPVGLNIFSLKVRFRNVSLKLICGVFVAVVNPYKV